MSYRYPDQRMCPCGGVAHVNPRYRHEEWCPYFKIPWADLRLVDKHKRHWAEVEAEGSWRGFVVWLVLLALCVGGIAAVPDAPPHHPAKVCTAQSKWEQTNRPAPPLCP